MKKIKLVSLLKNLNKQELEAFHKYIRRYHPKEKIALRVFEYLIRLYPNFDQRGKMRLEYAYQKIFKADFDLDGHAQKKMLNTASDLYNWLKTFLIASKTQQNQALNQMIWLGILQERGMKSEFSRKATAFYEQTRKAPFTSLEDALPNWMASYFHREHLGWDSSFRNVKTIQQCTDVMADCWELMRLKMACEMAVIRRASDPQPVHLLKEAADFQQLGLPVLKDIYEALWQLTDSGQEEHFVWLEYLLLHYGKHIDTKELEWMIRYAYNFTAHLSRQSDDEIQYQRMHRLNKIGLAYGVFLQGEHLPSSAYGNIVTVACHAKDFEWASGYIRDYCHIIKEDKREQALLLAQAILAYELGKFREVLSLLEHTRFDAQLDNLRSKSLILRSYYELQVGQDLILDTCASVENMLRRLPKIEAVKAMLAFVLVLKRLVVQKSSRQLILDCIEKAPTLYSKKWLLEKTGEYEARYAARKIAAKRQA